MGRPKIEWETLTLIEKGKKKKIVDYPHNQLVGISSRLRRTIEKKEAKIEKLKESIKNEIQSAIYAALKLNGLSNSIVRLTVTRGELDSGVNVDYSSPPTIVILVKPVKAISKKTYKEGIGIKLYKKSAIRTQGISNKIKSCNYLSNIILRENALKENFFEAILLDHNHNVTEGTISNIFIIKNNQLKTPITNEFVLSGIIRQAILDLCLENNIPFKEDLITERELYEADELFLTNSAIEILPVRNINHHKLKNRGMRPMTKHIHMLLLKSFEESS